MRIIFRSIATLLIVFTSISAQDLSKILLFAKQLKNEREYYRAITEYKRAISYFKDEIDFNSIKREIADCYYLAGHNLEAIQELKEILNSNQINKNAVLKISKFYNESGYYYESNDFISEIKNRFNDSFVDSLLMISAINYVYLKDFDNAKNIFQLIPNNSPLFSMRNKYINYLSELPNFKRRKLGGALNLVFPGSGYIYSGKIETGIAAFITNTIFGILFYNSIKENEINTAVFTGMVFSGFYFGSLTGGMQSADNYNKMTHNKFASKFKMP